MLIVSAVRMTDETGRRKRLCAAWMISRWNSMSTSMAAEIVFGHPGIGRTDAHEFVHRPTAGSKVRCHRLDRQADFEQFFGQIPLVVRCATRQY